MDCEELERLWRSRVAEARLRYEFACKYVKEVQRDLPLSDTTPDGQFAYGRAIRLMNLARAKYNRVLRIFTDLVAGGKIPDADEWPQGRDGSLTRLNPTVAAF